MDDDSGSGRDVVALFGVEEQETTVVNTREFIAACHDHDEFVYFSKRNKGSRFYLSWPLGCFILFRSDGELLITGNELRRLSDEYLCCREQLSVIGCLIGSFADHRYLCAFGNVTEIAHRLPVVLLGESSRIYAYDRDDDAMYLLGDDVEGFVKRGLRRFLPIYAEIGPMVYENELSETEDVVAFAVSHSEEAYAIPWPRGAYVKLILPRRRRSSDLESPMFYFACVSGRHLDPEFREILLATNVVGEILSYNPWDDRLVCVARNIRELFTIGLRNVRKTYCYRSQMRQDRSVPRCPHVPRIELPFPLRGEDSVLRCLTRLFNGFSKKREDTERTRETHH